jgi:hypothetical protein
MTAPADCFWVLTLQYPSPRGGFEAVTTSGVTVPSSVMRRDVYEGIVAEARRRLKVPSGTPAAVLFFYLEPASIGGRS